MIIEAVKLKKLSLADLPELKKISQKTYSDAFSSLNSDENMRMYLNFAFSEKKLTTELNEKNSEFYFAVYKDEIVGYLKINLHSAQTDLHENDGLELERIYVLQNFQGRKIGEKILSHVLKIARKRKMKYVWLGVWEKNMKAIRFYEKHGFTIYGTHPFEMGNEIQTDFIMKRNL